MRAELTVDLDLKSLENLRIFNGYDHIKQERRLSIESISSAEDNNESDEGMQELLGKAKIKCKPKCGRPLNPIPRHKRDSHIKAEYKRRDKIQKGFDTLISLVPALTETAIGKESKSAVLFKTADFCRRLKSDDGSTQKEIASLRQELEALGSEIHDLQDKLPNHGIETVNLKEASMDSLYDEYIQEQSKSNWIFWIFGYFMHPLYDSYKKATKGEQNGHQFNKSVLEWLQQTLSLTSLRKGVLEALRKISITTVIMTNPKDLKEEAQSRIDDHCVTKHQELLDSMQLSTCLSLPNSCTPANMSPAISRVPTPSPISKVSTPAPNSRTHTPALTPNPTPPRTPNVSRKSSKREGQRSYESRSRSNSPQPEENQAKRRSSYRSRSGRRSPNLTYSPTSDAGVAEFISSPPNIQQAMPKLTQLLISLSPRQEDTAPQFFKGMFATPTSTTVEAVVSSPEEIFVQQSSTHQNGQLSFSGPQPQMFNCFKPMTANSCTTFLESKTKLDIIPTMSDNLFPVTMTPSVNDDKTDQYNSFLSNLYESLTKVLSSSKLPQAHCEASTVHSAATSNVKQIEDTLITDNINSSPSVNSHCEHNRHLNITDNQMDDIQTEEKPILSAFDSITRSTVVPDSSHEDHSSFHEHSYIFEDSFSLDVFPMETSLCCVGSGSLVSELQSPVHVSHTEPCTFSGLEMSSSQAAHNHSDTLLNYDDDSMMNILNVDIMDVNSLMKYFEGS